MNTAILTVCITLLLRLWNIPLIRDRVFGWVDGLRGSILLERSLADGGQIGAMAIGLWHTAKRLGLKDGWGKLLQASPEKTTSSTKIESW